jgi:hypothetical protein
MNEETDRTQANPAVASHFRASDCYYHANARGTGSALKFELHPAHDDVPGSVFVKMAMQRTVASQQGGVPIFPTFDWKNGVSFKLDRSDLSQILQVLRGMQESVMDGKGLFHRSSAGNTVIKFSHQIEPRPGYQLSVWRRSAAGEAVNMFYLFSMDEAFALMMALERAMLYVCFGIPEVIHRQQAVWRQAAFAPSPQMRAAAGAPH